MKVSLFWILLLFAHFITESFCDTKKKVFGEKEVVFEFDIDKIRFDGSLPEGTTFVANHNVISAIKVYKGNVYVTIPRKNGQTGIPATLATIKNQNGQVWLSPFPNLEFQIPGSCTKNLQDVRSIEIDPQTDLMYIADNGNAKCDPKVLIYDLAKKVVNATYSLKTDEAKEVSAGSALGDISVNNKGVVFVSRSDKFGSLFIINTKDGKIYHVQSHTFRGTDFKPFVFENDTFSMNTSVNMLALTPDSTFLYYSANDVALWQVDTNLDKEQLNILEISGEIKNARKTGEKKHQGFSILMGNRFLFFSNVDNKSISYWDRKFDLKKQGEAESALVKENEKFINIQPKLEYFPGKMSLDEDGYLWVVTMDLARYFDVTLSTDPKIKIVKIFVDNRPYNNPEKIVSGSGRIFLSAVIVFVCCLLTAM